MKAKIKTIDVTAKEWFDKVNGNSYFSANVVINYGMNSCKSISLPFQYGYGNQYECEVLEVIKQSINKNIVKGFTGNSLSRFCQDHNIVLRSNKITNCKKSEL